jgi:hypothetical protein
MRAAIPPLPNTSSWRGTYLSTATILPFQYVIKSTRNEVIRAVSPVTVEVHFLAVMISRTSYPRGTGCSFPVVKRPGPEADHSSPSSAEVKDVCSYTSIPQYVFMA